MIFQIKVEYFMRKFWKELSWFQKFSERRVKSGVKVDIFETHKCLVKLEAYWYRY